MTEEQRTIAKLEAIAVELAQALEAERYATSKFYSMLEISNAARCTRHPWECTLENELLQNATREHGQAVINSAAALSKLRNHINA